MDRIRLVKRLQSRLEEKADAKTKAWWEAYLKQAVPFRGVKMADVRSALHVWYVTEGIGGQLSVTEQKQLALALFEEENSEDKIAGILFLREILLPAGAVEWRTDLKRFADLFDAGWISDWNVCDWFCVKVLGPLVEKEGEACARRIGEWRTADNLWRRRASGVAFVDLAKNGDENFAGFIDILLQICESTVRHPERFSQTGTGWVLRELSIAEPHRVQDFVGAHVCEFSTEGLRYALGKLSPAAQDSLRRMRAACNAPS
jgi:3-methyladenine DNA glycosylase AlkD